MGFLGNDNNIFGKKDKGQKKDSTDKEAVTATAMAVWHSLPISVKLGLIGGIAAAALIIIILVAILGAIPSVFLDYSDDASDTKQIKEEFNEYWEELCEESNPDCSEEQIQKAKELQESQTAFYEKLDSLVEKNHMTSNQKYIVLTTIFYNLEIDDFTAGMGAFELDDNDEINYDANTDGKSVYEREKDTLKELIKQFKVNTAFCEYTQKNSAGEEETVTNTLRSPSGTTFSFNFFDNFMFGLGRDPDVKGFKEAKDACKALTNGRIYMETSYDSAASIDGYYKYLLESDYLDTRPQHKTNYDEYASKNNLSKDISTWTEEDKREVRSKIINDIKSIVASYSKDTNSNKTYLVFGSDVGYWWPIGSADVVEANGKYYATGDPYPYTVTSEGGGRIDPITHQPATHSGIDIAPNGAKAGVVPVIAAKSGKVVFPSKTAQINYGNGNGIGGSTYGNYVIIQHTDGNYTLYAHLHADSILVRDGESVEQGQVIAYAGSSGRSTGTHLHFEVREGQNSYNSVTDPRKYISESDPRPQSSISNEFVTWLNSLEGITGTDETKTKYLVKDIGDGVRTVGSGVTLDAQKDKFAARGIDVDDYPIGSYIDIDIVDSVKMQVLEEAASSIETTLSNAGLTLEKEKIEALIIFKYGIGNINGFTDAYKQYGDTQALYDNYFGKYIHVDGEVWPSLIRRREKEWELFHNHVYVY